MAFTVEDLQDLIRLIDAHPEWRAELRRHVLGDELLALPQAIQALAEAQARTEARLEELAAAQVQTEARLGRVEAAVEQLAAAQARTEVRLEGLAEAQARTEARLEELAAAQVRTEARLGRVEAAVEQLAAAQARTEARLEGLAATMQELATALARTEAGLQGLTDVVQALGLNHRRLDAQFRGARLEHRYRTRPGAYLRRLIRDARTLTDEELDRVLRPAEESGQLQEEDTADIFRADAVVRGRRRSDGQELYLVVEVSWVVGTSDVERALRRAQLLARAGAETLPVVAGGRITPAALRFAESAHVERVTDGTELDELEPDGTD